MPEKVAIIGSGNWGSAISRIVGKNAELYPEFKNNVNMWVYEEMINGRKLTDIINTENLYPTMIPNNKPNRNDINNLDHRDNRDNRKDEYLELDN